MTAVKLLTSLSVTEIVKGGDTALKLQKVTDIRFGMTAVKVTIIIETNCKDQLPSQVKTTPSPSPSHSCKSEQVIIVKL